MTEYRIPPGARIDVRCVYGPPPAGYAKVVGEMHRASARHFKLAEGVTDERRAIAIGRALQVELDRLAPLLLNFNWPPPPVIVVRENAA